MKRLLLFTSFMVLISGCEKVVVDKNGNVQTEFKGFIEIGSIPMDNQVDPNLYQDTITGCKYVYVGHSMMPYYNAEGKVDGCGNK